MEIKINNATLSASYSEADWMDENLGDSRWTFKWREVMRVCKKLPELEQSGMCYGLRDILEEARQDCEPEELPDLMVTLPDVDMGICVVACMIQLGGEWEIYWEGDSEYWFFHDMTHAEFDFCPNARGKITLPEGIPWEDEHRAMVLGAKKAREAGVSLGDIARQVARAELAWADRFGSENFMLEECLD